MKTNRATIFALLLGTGVIGLSACVSSSPIDPVTEPAEQPSAYTLQIDDWRTNRQQRLQKPDGWLSLVGLHWLQPGSNRIGAAEDNDLVLAYGPEYWGVVILEQDDISFQANDNTNTQINNAAGLQARLNTDLEGDTTIVSSGSTQFHVIDRGSYGLRVKDAQAPNRVNFAGLDYFPINENWRVEAEFVPAEEGETILIGNVLNSLSDERVYGTAVFQKDGRENRLVALGEPDDDSLFIIFSDRTNNRETYGAGRFMYTGLPENGKLILDFNKAYNPPCAFNDYSTCPLPPPENRLAIRVTAGEKDYKKGH